VDSLITAAARALAAGDPLDDLRRVHKWVHAKRRQLAEMQ
jgi:hypothetical protein